MAIKAFEGGVDSRMLADTETRSRAGHNAVFELRMGDPRWI